MEKNNLLQFIKKNGENRLTIDSVSTAGFTSDFVVSSVRTHSPDKILIIGGGRELSEKLSPLVKNVYMLVEDTDIAVSPKSLPKNVSYICGRATDLPVDYHSIQMAICADYLDLYDSSRLIDELKRALDFEGFLLIAGRVCCADDLDGIYDELYRSLNPFHNDFYLVSDLKTFLSLKEINYVNEAVMTFSTDFADFAPRVDAVTGENRAAQALVFLDENRKAFTNLYKLHGNTLEEIYYAGLFRCQKPEFEDYEEELRKVRKLSGIVE